MVVENEHILIDEYIAYINFYGAYITFILKLYDDASVYVIFFFFFPHTFLIKRVWLLKCVKTEDLLLFWNNNSSFLFCDMFLIHSKTNKLHGLSPRANYTDRATAACRRSECQLLQIKGATWSAWCIPTAVFSVF
jgi:hypothetical protein